MAIFDDIFWAIIFWLQCERFCRQISLNIVKYRSTQISKVFDKYRQISSMLMTYSIEFQVISKDAASKVKNEVSNKTSLIRVFSLKDTESKMSHKKNLLLKEK